MSNVHRIGDYENENPSLGGNSNYFNGGNQMSQNNSNPLSAGKLLKISILINLSYSYDEE